MLLFADHSFLQILEGSKADVEHIFKLIKTDARHNGVMKLWADKICERNFKDWSMGFEHLPLIEMPGLNNIIHLDRRGIQDKLTGTPAPQIKSFISAFYAMTTRGDLKMIEEASR